MKNQHIWYACYGSNINKARFMRYIDACSDTTPPIEDRHFIFPHDVYFADKSVTWDNKAVAFLDDTMSGRALGRIYKITREQYEEVKLQEGRKYTKFVDLGTVEGIPVYTFTCPQQYDEHAMPSEAYVSTILAGLEEVYPEKDILELKSYLVDLQVEKDDFDILKAIKEAPHGVSNQMLTDMTNLDLSAVQECIKHLLTLALIKQDGRSVRAGHRISDSEAYFYTVPDMRSKIQEMIAIKTDYDELVNYGINSSQESIVEPVHTGSTEGAPRLVFSTRYERDTRNRRAAIQLHGAVCQICGFDFKKTYGSLGENFIEVHHIKPLSEVNGEVHINPETDLVCVCSNCHSMLHRRRDKVLTVEELKRMIEEPLEDL